jgi:hypothetical protein
MPDETIKDQSGDQTTGGGSQEEPKTFTPEYVSELRKENAAWRKQVRELQQWKEQQEQEAQKRNETDLVSQKKFEDLANQYKAQLDKVQTDLQTQQIMNLRVQIAAEAGLPAALAERLKGATAEEIKADAEAMKALIPAPTGQRQGQNTTPAPGGQPAGETDAQRRQRLLGNGRDPFSGGGVKISS